MNFMLKEGDLAPDFCLTNQEGKDVCLKDFKGQWVVLYFYPKDNTPGCTLEAKGFTKNIDTFIEKDAFVIGVSKDSVNSHVKFISKHKLKISLLSDPDHKVMEKYDSWIKKKLYGREYFGTQRNTFLIDPEAKIHKIWKKVKVKGHVDEVILTLN